MSKLFAMRLFFARISNNNRNSDNNNDNSLVLLEICRNFCHAEEC